MNTDKYKGKWVAIADRGSRKERIVASGARLRDAVHDAKEKGFDHPTYRKIDKGTRI